MTSFTSLSYNSVFAQTADFNIQEINKILVQKANFNILVIN
jgi:hypothetical protein